MTAIINNSVVFRSYAEKWGDMIDARLMQRLPAFKNVNDRLWQEATEDAVFNGGKRTRPLLAIMGWQVIANHRAETLDSLLDLATAIEYIHCSSLVFDDLPCMDNATLRRGKKTLHIKYGEDKAILVALGLLLRGIELVFKMRNGDMRPPQIALLAAEMMDSIGVTGLICGQWFDICAKESESAHLIREELNSLRNLKTMPLIRFAILGGAIVGDANAKERDVLASFAKLVGESYQTIDDLLDLMADSEYSGKDMALDLKNDRLNAARDDRGLMIDNLQSTLAAARQLLANNLPYQQLDRSTISDEVIRARIALTGFTEYLAEHLQGAVTTSSLISKT